MLKVITSNIRFDNPKDGKHNWDNRKKVLSSYFNSSKAHLIGTQEGRRLQLKELENLLDLKLLDTHRKWIEERMYPTFFYHPDFLEILDSGDIWLSETPYKAGSKSFKSSFPRLATWIKAKDINTGIIFFAVNAHLDHILQSTRILQIQVLAQEIKKINSSKLPYIFLGDFNDTPYSPVRKSLLKEIPSNIIDPWIDLNMKEESSYHKFGMIKESEGARIDWILIDSSIQSKNLKMIKDSQATIYPSDHYPIEIQLIF